MSQLGNRVAKLEANMGGGARSIIVWAMDASDPERLAAAEAEGAKRLAALPGWQRTQARVVICSWEPAA